MPGNLREIFEAAVGMAPAEREAYLRGACGGDSVLREDVEALLLAHERAAGFLESPTSGEAPGAVEPVLIEERPGSRIGVYRVLQKIGEGGFGSVLMAEQEEPVRRKVALKIIKLGMDTRRVIARFEAERQALALMDHPHIAKVFDAGATQSGRPYFVMELVKGEPITEYCDRNSLSIPDRAELFVQVCNAVQHAHQKGVIHRDLKPGNVLVATHDGRPFAKIIDFGIAKATDHRLTEKTLFTELRALLGTPEYMSPEQAEGSLDIDTRSDVYSLGVLLYELLTGATPFDPETLRSAAYGEIQRIIREVEPPRPSTRLSSLRAGRGASGEPSLVRPAEGKRPSSLEWIAAHRRVEPARLGTLLRGDLDWIVMKSLEKDRARRYETASALAADIVRHLKHEPVVAAPPSPAYLLRRFVRRHAAPVVAGALVVCALAIGLGVATFQYFAARRERDAKAAALAAAEASNKKQVAIEDFLVHRMLGSGNADWGGAPSLTVREVVDRAAAQAKDIEDPEVRGAVRHELGVIYATLGLLEESRQQLQGALEARESLPGRPNEGTARTLIALANVARIEGQSDRADELLLRAMDVARTAAGPGSLLVAEVECMTAAVLRGRGREHDAAAHWRAAQTIVNGVAPAGAEPTLAADVLAGLAHYEIMQGRPAAGAEMLEQAVVILRRHGEGDALADCLATLSEARVQAGELDKAQSAADEAYEIRRRVLTPNHPNIAQTLVMLATLRMQGGEFEKAEKLAREAIDVYSASLGPTHEYTAQSITALAAIVASQGRWEDAARECARAATILAALFPPDDWRLANARSMQGACLAEIDRFEEAETLLTSAHAALDRTKARIDLLVISSQRLSDLYSRWKKPDKAAEWEARTKALADQGVE